MAKIVSTKLRWFVGLTVALVQSASPWSVLAGNMVESETNSDASSSMDLANEATTALRGEEYDQAILLLRKAISLNPNDAGAEYDPMQFRQEYSSDHGRAQVLKMITDRPLMDHNLDRSGDLWNWTAWKFSAKINDSELNWDPSSTDDPDCTAQVHIPHPGDPGYIRIRELPPTAASYKGLAFEKLWSSAIYELHNIDNASEFDRLYEQARLNQISEDEFIKKMFAIELKAAQRTRKWYVEIYLPYVKKNELWSQPTWWHCEVWGSAESNMAKHSNKDGYPWAPYSRFYRGLRAEKPGN